MNGSLTQTPNGVQDSELNNRSFASPCPSWPYIISPMTPLDHRSISYHGNVGPSQIGVPSVGPSPHHAASALPGQGAMAANSQASTMMYSHGASQSLHHPTIGLSTASGSQQSSQIPTGMNVSQNGLSGAPSSSRNQRLITAAEQIWFQIASTANLLGNAEKAQGALEVILRHNPSNTAGLLRLGHVLHNQQQYLQAAEIYQRILAISEATPSAVHNSVLGATWAALAHCHLLLEELPKAFQAYQHALSFPGTAKDASVWFGVGLLYDRYGADDHALESFSAVLRLEGFFTPPSSGATGGSSPYSKIPSNMVREVYLRMGQLFRHRKQFKVSLDCLDYSLNYPPMPLSIAEVQVQRALTLSAQGDTESTFSLLEDIIEHINTHPSHDSHRSTLSRAKTLLGWQLHLESQTKDRPSVGSQRGLAILQEVVQTDPNDSLAWYFLGRTQYAMGAFNKSYEAYQEAVFREGQNAAFWNSIGILYLEIRQFRDALDAFTRAVQQSSTIPEIWWNLGLLYESCNSQLSDAVDAYQRAAELSQDNHVFRERLNLLRGTIASNSVPSPPPKDTMEVDPFLVMTRPILLGGVQIPPQKPTLPPSIASILSNPVPSGPIQAALPSPYGSQHPRMPPLPGSNNSSGGAMPRAVPPPSASMMSRPGGPLLHRPAPYTSSGYTPMIPPSGMPPSSHANGINTNSFNAMASITRSGPSLVPPASMYPHAGPHGQQTPQYGGPSRYPPR